MTALVVPFPLARRRDMIHRQAEYALCLKPEKAEQHIQRQLQTQATAMRRREIAESLIKRELVSMEAAIRDAWRAEGGFHFRCQIRAMMVKAGRRHRWMPVQPRRRRWT